MWLGIEIEDDLDVPLPEETLIRFQTFELDSRDLARRFAKTWERLEFVADIAISNLFSELLVVAASGVRR